MPRQVNAWSSFVLKERMEWTSGSQISVICKKVYEAVVEEDFVS